MNRMATGLCSLLCLFISGMLPCIIASPGSTGCVVKLGFMGMLLEPMRNLSEPNIYHEMKYCINTSFSLKKHNFMSNPIYNNTIC